MVAVVGIVGDRRPELHLTQADLVEPEGRRRLLVERVDVDPVAQGADLAGDHRRTDLEEVLASGHQRRLVHPHQARLKARGDRRHVVGEDEHIAAADVDLVLQGEDHGPVGEGLLEVAVVGDDPADLAALLRRQDHHLVAAADDPRGDGAGEAAEVEVRPDHVLHRKAEVLHVAVRADVHGLEEPHQGLALVPGHRRRAVDDVVALERGERDEVEVGDVEAGREVAVVLDDLLVAGLVEVDQVHLVDRDDDVADSEERGDEAVALGLRQDPAADVDEDDRQITLGGAGRHVPGVLLVPRGVGDDELALLGGEVAVGDVDRDPLLALGLETVGEERRVEEAVRVADGDRVAGDRRELVLVDHLAVVEETADEGALAVVDRAAGQEAEQLLALVAVEVGVDVLLDEVRLVRHGL